MATVDFDDLFGSDGDRGHLAVPPRPFHSPPICISMAVTSRGRPIKFIPKLTELACAELARREQSASPRAPGSGSRSRARLSDCHAIAVAVFAYLYQ